MGASERFDRYTEHLCEGLGHAGLEGYCTGLMLPLARKSVEPMAAVAVDRKAMSEVWG
jgi:SRSO17 transposase